MEITDVHVKLIRNSSDRLKAVCTITFDGEFVVRDVKVVEGTNGMFVAMPSRKLSIHCKSCNHKNHLRSKFCNECGAKVDSKPQQPDNDGRTRLHRDIAHPITPAFRERVQEHVIKAYEAELKESPIDVENDVETVHETVDETKQPIKEDVEKDPSKGSDFDDYDEIIASLKGSQKKKERPDHAETSDRSPSEEEGNDNSSSRFSDTDDYEANTVEDSVSISESVESPPVTSRETADAPVNQTTSVDSDDDGAFGEGIL